MTPADSSAKRAANAEMRSEEPALLRFVSPTDTLGRDRELRAQGTRAVLPDGSKAGIQPKHASRLRLQLGRLDTAAGPQDMNLPGWRLHPLKGDLKGQWAVWVDENWRLVFAFEGEDAVLVDYTDYH